MSDPSSYGPVHAHNRRAWDQMVSRGDRFTRPAPDADFNNPLGKVDSLGWLGPSIVGLELLCLAAGGGKHSVLYAAAGAKVTVVDISPAMLELDREVAAERNLPIRTVEASMDDLAALADGAFDVVVHPVSTCYVPDVRPVFLEVARITRPGGLYISQHKSPTSLQADTRPSSRGYELLEPYLRVGPLPEVVGSRHREEGTLEFLHTWEDLLGGICRAGFAIEDIAEPLHAKLDALPGDFGHRSQYVSPYMRIKARRNATAVTAAKKSGLWTP